MSEPEDKRPADAEPLCSVAPVGTKKEWQTPELVLMDVRDMTRGGFAISKVVGDDTFYRS